MGRLTDLDPDPAELEMAAFGVATTKELDCTSWLPQPDVVLGLGGLLNVALPAPSDRQRGSGFTCLAVFLLEVS